MFSGKVWNCPVSVSEGQRRSISGQVPTHRWRLTGSGFCYLLKPKSWSLTCIINEIKSQLLSFQMNVSSVRTSSRLWPDETPQRWFWIFHIWKYIFKICWKNNTCSDSNPAERFWIHTQKHYWHYFWTGVFYRATNNHKHQNLQDDPSHAV